MNSDKTVAEPDDKAVFRSVVFVLRLRNKPLTGIVISLSFPAPAVLDLEAREVESW